MATTGTGSPFLGPYTLQSRTSGSTSSPTTQPSIHRLRWGSGSDGRTTATLQVPEDPHESDLRKPFQSGSPCKAPCALFMLCGLEELEKTAIVCLNMLTAHKFEAKNMFNACGADWRLKNSLNSCASSQRPFGLRSRQLIFIPVCRRLRHSV